jgi:uncharacterized protein (TIGR02246 family)
MRYTCSIAAFAAAAALMTACSTAPPAAPPDTRAADEQAVKDVEVAWSKDAATKDPDKFASYYSDDAVGLFPGAPTLSGKQAIRAALAPMMADPNFAMSFQGTRAEASKGGDLVYTVGAYTMTMTNPKTKKPSTDKGKYMTVFKKQADGSWKAVADTFNSDSM